MLVRAPARVEKLAGLVVQLGRTGAASGRYA